MRVRFWGVRGSCPTPLTSDDIAARLTESLWRLGCARETLDLDTLLSDRAAIERWVATLPSQLRAVVGGNTPCLEMRTADNDLFIIDLGSGLRGLGNELVGREFGRGRGHAHLFLSHYHWDHIQGWPFFKPAYIPGNRLDLYSRHQHLETRLRHQQEAPFFPPASWDDMRADVSYHQMDDGALELCDGRVRITSIELDHPSRAYAYRFEADGKVFIYASDGAYHNLDDLSIGPYVAFFHDADLLVFDAQFTLTESFEKRTWGHSSAIIGVELACQAGVKNLALFHHDPGADDATLDHLLQVGEQYASIVPSAVRRTPNQCRLLLAREGMTMEL
jgi:phosphoribosyl 1,2-cyclic phosphodiesterase